MFKEIIDIILYSMEGSFLQVTVFVGAVLMMFNYINFKTKGAFIETIKKCQEVSTDYRCSSRSHTWLWGRNICYAPLY